MKRVKFRADDGSTYFVEHTPLTAQRALEIVDKLSEEYVDVFASGVGPTATVYARGNNRRIQTGLGCPHHRKLIARNVQANVRQGYLSSCSQDTPTRRYAQIIFCQRCDFVIDYEADSWKR